MDPEKPTHPYRDPVELALEIASVPWGAALQGFDDLGTDVRVGLMTHAFDDDPRESVVDSVVSLLHACDVLDTKIAGLRSYVAPTALFVGGLGAIASKFFPGPAGDVVAVVLLILSALPWLLIAPLSRVEAVAKRVRYAAEAMEKYITTRALDPDPRTGLRVDGAEAGASAEAEALSAQAPPQERKGRP